jgi:hypothetical protein
VSVINVTKMWSTSSGSLTSPKADALDKTYVITEGYQVLAEIGDDITEIWEAAGLPSSGEQHASGVAAFVTSIVPTALGPCFWQAIITYEGESPDPESIEIEWTDTTSSEPIDRDINGRAIVTANGEQIEGLTMDISDQVLIVRKRFLTINTFAIGPYRHATNSDEFLGWPAGTARLVGYSAKNRYKYGAPQEQWDVTARFQMRVPYGGATAAQAWYKRWRHEGLILANGGRAIDSTGIPASRPVLLKLDGTQETDPEAAVFVYTQVYDSLPYSGLGLI